MLYTINIKEIDADGDRLRAADAKRTIANNGTNGKSSRFITVTILTIQSDGKLISNNNWHIFFSFQNLHFFSFSRQNLFCWFCWLRQTNWLCPSFNSTFESCWKLKKIKIVIPSAPGIARGINRIEPKFTCIWSRLEDAKTQAKDSLQHWFEENYTGISRRANSDNMFLHFDG